MGSEIENFRFVKTNLKSEKIAISAKIWSMVWRPSYTLAPARIAILLLLDNTRKKILSELAN